MKYVALALSFVSVIGCTIFGTMIVTGHLATTKDLAAAVKPAPAPDTATKADVEKAAAKTTTDVVTALEKKLPTTSPDVATKADLKGLKTEMVSAIKKELAKKSAPKKDPAKSLDPTPDPDPKSAPKKTVKVSSSGGEWVWTTGKKESEENEELRLLREDVKTLINVTENGFRKQDETNAKFHAELSKAVCKIGELDVRVGKLEVGFADLNTKFAKLLADKERIPEVDTPPPAKKILVKNVVVKNYYEHHGFCRCKRDGCYYGYDDEGCRCRWARGPIVIDNVTVYGWGFRRC